jgi:electron transfer flavoprotein alpha subunit
LSLTLGQDYLYSISIMSVLVFVTSNDGKISKTGLEATSYANKVAASMGTTVTAVTHGNVSDEALSSLGNFGATKVMIARNLTVADSSQLSKLVVAAATEEGADIVITSLDPTGKEVAPRVSARMGAGLVTGATALPTIDGGFRVKKNVYSGKAVAEVQINSAKKVVALMPNAITPEATGGTAAVSDFNPEVGAATITVKEKKGAGGALSLPEAELVVSAGRGLKGPENWGMIEELAGILGAATACSRPVADIGWRPHHEHVGQTGIAIRPDLYIAVGISGAIQHLAGVNSSKVIVVINTDAEAPFFKAADYGIVGDAFEVVPKLIASAKAFMAEN